MLEHSNGDFSLKTSRVDSMGITQNKLISAETLILTFLFQAGISQNVSSRKAVTKTWGRLALLWYVNCHSSFTGSFSHWRRKLPPQKAWANQVFLSRLTTTNALYFPQQLGNWWFFDNLNSCFPEGMIFWHCFLNMRLAVENLMSHAYSSSVIYSYGITRQNDSLSPQMGIIWKPKFL